MRKKILPVLVGGVLTLVALVGAFTYRMAYAQSSTPTPAAPAQTGKGPGMGPRGVSDQELANALGISLDQLQTAQKSATDEALKEAVSAGLITQAQADQFAQNEQNAQNGHPFPGLPPLKDSSIDYNALLAKALGISTDQLQAVYQKAYYADIDAAVANGSMTQAQADEAKGRYALSNDSNFQSAMKSAFEAAVNQAVSSGVITQAQADQILQNDSGMMGWPGLGGPGGRGGPGGPNGWNGGTPPNPPSGTANPNSAAPTATP
jgi:hypothetical protein